jgi:hypothetical protein
VKLSFSLSSIVWILEANKGVYGFTFGLTEDLYTFNFTEFSKVLFEFLFTSVGWEVLNIEIASLFGLFESHLLLLLFLFSFRFVQELSDVELEGAE